MTVKLRVAGDPDEVTAVLDALSAVLEVAYDGRTYPQRGGFGVRAYAEARLPGWSAGPSGRSANHGTQAEGADDPVRVRSERADRSGTSDQGADRSVRGREQRALGGSGVTR